MGLRGGLKRAGERLVYGAHVLNLAYFASSVSLLFVILDSMAVRGAPALSVRSVGVSVVALIFLGTVLLGGKLANIILCLLATATLGITQVQLNPRRVAEYPASSTRNPVPYMMFAGLPGEDDHNELGYRGMVPPMPKTDEYRVLMIGGSAVYGRGDNWLTIPNQLRKMAKREISKDIWVYNWGVVSQVSGQELATIAHRASRYSPDLVILYDGGNDIYTPFTTDPRPGYPFNFTVSERAVGIFQRGDLGALNAGVLTQSNLLRAAFPLELSDAAADLAPLRRSVGFQGPRWEGEVVQNYLDNLDTACRMGEGLGYRLAVFLQPVVYFTPQADRYRGMGSDFRSYVERQYARIRQGLDGLSQRHKDGGCFFADLSRVCQKGECVFSDFIHPTPNTRTPIAEAMLVALRDHGLLRPAKASPSH